MVFNNLPDIFTPLPMCDDCLIHELPSNHSKVLAQDSVDFLVVDESPKAILEEVIEEDTELSEHQKRAVADCWRRHVEGACIVKFCDEVE